MKTKKVVVGAIAATMLSLSVCPIAPAAAAGETVQISVSKAEAEAGKQFTVDVSLADIPSTGIATLDFAIEFDNKVITIDEVKVGASAKTGADSADSTGEVPVFDSAVYNDEGFVELLWTTGLDDSSYYMKKDGVFCTITGTVASTATEGKVADLKVVPSKRNLNPDSGDKITSISCGYFNGDEKVSYTVKANNGSVTVGSEDKFPRGDANCSGEVKMNDAVLIMQMVANADAYGTEGTDSTHITEKGYKLADVAGGDNDKGGDGVTSRDALRIQEYLIGKVTEL